MPKYDKTITIKRSKWRRGRESEKTGLHHTQLYNPTEPTSRNMCCLGQYLQQCGVPKHKLSSIDSPMNVDLDIKVNKFVSLLIVEDPWDTTNLSEAAMQINDAPKFTEKEREKQLKALFKPHGIKIVFVP